MRGDQPSPFVKTYWVEWEEDVRAAEPADGYRPIIGRRRMKCEVQVVIDLPAVVRNLGRRAATNVTKKSVDGSVTVRRLGDPVEVARVMAEKK